MTLVHEKRPELTAMTPVRSAPLLDITTTWTPKTGGGGMVSQHPQLDRLRTGFSHRQKSRGTVRHEKATFYTVCVGNSDTEFLLLWLRKNSDRVLRTVHCAWISLLERGTGYFFRHAANRLEDVLQEKPRRYARRLGFPIRPEIEMLLFSGPMSR